MSIKITPKNINDYMSEIELFLNSFYDSTFLPNPSKITLYNDNCKITYEKHHVKYNLTLTILSP